MRGQIGRCANEVMQEHSLEGEKTHSSSSIVELAPGTGGALPFDMIGEPSDGFFLFEALLVPKLRLPQGCSTNPRQLPRGRRCAVSKRQPAGLPHTEEAAGTRFERIRDRSRVARRILSTVRQSRPCHKSKVDGIPTARTRCGDVAKKRSPSLCLTTERSRPRPPHSERLAMPSAIPTLHPSPSCGSWARPSPPLAQMLASA